MREGKGREGKEIYKAGEAGESEGKGGEREREERMREVKGKRVGMKRNG